MTSRRPGDSGEYRRRPTEIVDEGLLRVPSGETARFEGTERFEVRRRLGSGGMGVVYEAFDRQRAQHVALKTIRYGNPHALFTLKNEFRALADLSHPNLIELYDLVTDGDDTFFTMELVPGVDFVHYCRTPFVQEASDEGSGGTASDEQTTVSGPFAPGFDEVRLRASLVQLAKGLMTLHGVGKLHRDVKPSNALVTDMGRLVLLDFGLARDIEDDREDTFTGEIRGTPAYMSPEQARGERELGAASDWYSVGVMLYEALTGELPHRGLPLEVLMNKQAEEPPPPREVNPLVPIDLDELCAALLATEADARPGGDEVWRRLGVERRSSGRLTAPHRSSPQIPFAGRVDEFAQMDRSRQLLERGRTSAVLVRGRSGIGKTALVREYVRQLTRRLPQVVALRGRCYESEDIPYKAIDGLVDHLSRFWRHLPREQATGLLPREASYLAPLFPVLERVDAVAEAPRRDPIEDPQELRSRAFGAFRELLQRLGDRRQLILSLDDMQWVDADTVALLSDVLRPPDPPRLLLVMAARTAGEQPSGEVSGASGRSSLLADLLSRLDIPVDELALGPLAESDAVALARQYLGDADPELSNRVAEESHGSPFLLGELTRYVQLAEAPRLREIRLEEALRFRLDALAVEARRILEVVCVAGRPVSHQIVAAATDLDLGPLTRQARALRAGSFVRVAGGRTADLIEPYHDQIRQATVAQLDPAEQRRHHQGLALALARFGGSNEQLARHWLGAAEPTRAARYARRAADESMTRLDFDRAAELYQMVLSLGRREPSDERELHTRLAEALANAGRLREAAQSFEDAADGARGIEQLELRRQAAEKLLIGGYARAGKAAIREVLRALGMRFPGGRFRAVVQLLWDELALRVRGIRWRQRPEADIPSRTLARIDTCYSVSAGVVMADFFLGTVFTKRGLRLALKSGEPYRIGLFMTAEALLQANAGFTGRARRLLEAGRVAARQHGSELARFYPLFFEAQIQYNADFALARCIETLDEAEGVWHSAGRGRSWELDACAIWSSFAARWMGDVPQVTRRRARYARLAERTGNRFLAVTLRTGLLIEHLARDRAEQGLADVRDAIASWDPMSPDGVDIQAMLAFGAHCEASLYLGDLTIADDEIRRTWPGLRRSPQLLHPLSRIHVHHSKARVALAHGAQDEGRAAANALAEAARWARKLTRTRHPAAPALGGLIHAGVAHLRGDDSASLTHLEEAQARFEGHDLKLYAAAAIRRQGQIRGGDQGTALMAEADAAMSELDVVDPARLTGVLAPGWE